MEPIFFSVVVLEIPDQVLRRTPNLPNIFVVVRGKSADGGLSRPKGLPRSINVSEAQVRRDLSPLTQYQTPESAKKRRDRVAMKLARLGYTVNPNKNSTYSVYVLELQPTTLGTVRLYVGQTSKPVADRIADHLRGVKASRLVTTSFTRRRPTLEPKRTFSSPWDAIAEETALGQRLLDRGFDVVGPQGLKRS